MNFVKIPYMPDPSNTISCILHLKNMVLQHALACRGQKLWKNKALFDLESWMDVIWPIHDVILDRGHVSWFSARWVSAPLPRLFSTLWADSADTHPVLGCWVPLRSILAPQLLWVGHRTSKAIFWHREEIFWSEFGRFPKRPAPSKQKASLHYLM